VPDISTERPAPPSRTLSNGVSPNCGFGQGEGFLRITAAGPYGNFTRFPEHGKYCTTDQRILQVGERKYGFSGENVLLTEKFFSKMY